MEKMNKTAVSADEKLAFLEAENKSLKEELVELKAQNNWLMEQLKLSNSRQYGPSSEKSEKGEYEQLNLFNEAEAIADSSEEESETVEVEKHTRKKKTSFKDRLPEDLPRETIVYELTENELDCPECGEEMQAIGKEIREELVIIPAKAIIREHVTVTYACRTCDKENIKTPFRKAKAPEPVIKGGFASPEAVAYTMTQKFVMGLPLYRQEQEWDRSGVPVSRQTLSNWFIRATEDWLKPVYNQLISLLILSEVLHADETTLQVLHEPGKTAVSKSYMWLYRTSGNTDRQIILYEYQPSRRAEHPKDFLKDFNGYLHADGYDGYHNLPGNIEIVGCWAHARRKFVEALKALPEKDRKNAKSYKAKQYIDRLFKNERRYAELSPEERLLRRQKESKPVADEFFEWLSKENSGMTKTLFATAANYAVSQKKYLQKYLCDGRLEISNNRAERSMKTFAVDRKNFLFCNTVSGANASAVAFSLIETAKANGLIPFQYLTYVFKTAPNIDLSNPDELKSLLPFRDILPSSVLSSTSKRQINSHNFAWDCD